MVSPCWHICNFVLQHIFNILFCFIACYVSNFININALEVTDMFYIIASSIANKDLLTTKELLPAFITEYFWYL